ncbi:MAG: hypothetical protein ACE5JM_04495 [Armatimonadota bacterium]
MNHASRNRTPRRCLVVLWLFAAAGPAAQAQGNGFREDFAGPRLHARWTLEGGDSQFVQGGVLLTATGSEALNLSAPVDLARLRRIECDYVVLWE